MNETFEINLRNHKTSRSNSAWWSIFTGGAIGTSPAKSDEFKKKDAQTIEFHVPVQPDEEKT